MTEQELKKMSRKELIHLLLCRDLECDALRAKLAEAEASLKDRRIHLEEAGSIAEAALRLNGVFESAQKAAEQYLENIRQKSEKIDLQMKRAAETIRKMEEHTRQKCEILEAAAKQGGSL